MSEKGYLWYCSKVKIEKTMYERSILLKINFVNEECYFKFKQYSNSLKSFFKMFGVNSVEISFISSQHDIKATSVISEEE
jgi:hypothetical protein